jgi:hypothetical protein
MRIQDAWWKNVSELELAREPTRAFTAISSLRFDHSRDA